MTIDWNEAWERTDEIMEKLLPSIKRLQEENGENGVIYEDKIEGDVFINVLIMMAIAELVTDEIHGNPTLQN